MNEMEAEIQRLKNDLRDARDREARLERAARIVALWISRSAAPVDGSSGKYKLLHEALTYESDWKDGSVARSAATEVWRDFGPDEAAVPTLAMDTAIAVKDFVETCTKGECDERTWEWAFDRMARAFAQLARGRESQP